MRDSQHLTCNCDSAAARAKIGLPLHALSWFVLLVSIVCVALITLPGSADTSIEWERHPLYSTLNPVTGQMLWSDFDFIEVSTWSHGWPFEFMRRPYVKEGFLIDFKGYPVLWSTPKAWEFFGRRYTFKPLPLIADLAIGTAIVVIVVTVCECWRRRRGAWRISLVDAALAAVAVSAGLGWWKYHVRLQAAERTSIAAMTARGSLSSPSHPGPRFTRAGKDYHGPTWLRRLVGNPYLISWCIHVDTLVVNSQELIADDRQDIRSFRFLRKLQLIDQLTPELAQTLTELPRLQMLDGDVNMSGTGRPHPAPMINSSNIGLLRKLPRLSTLRLGTTQFSTADVQVLAELPKLATLQLRDRGLLVEDLEHLTQAQSIQTLELDITSIANERSAFIAKHRDWVIRWAKRPPIPTEWENRFEASEESKVMALFLQRWGMEDAATDPATIDFDAADFSQIRLTADRVDRIPPNALAKVEQLSLGFVESVSAAEKLIQQCGKIRDFDGRRIPLTKSALDAIDLSEKAELYLQQGPITLEEFCEFNQELKPHTLVIFGSTFSEKQAEQIQAASPDTNLEVYPGYADDYEKSIYPTYEMDSESPFE
jgi:hypothetical protein